MVTSRQKFSKIANLFERSKTKSSVNQIIYCSLNECTWVNTG
jgi:hypothetical protein